MRRRFLPTITRRWPLWACAALALCAAGCTSSDGGGGGSDGMGKLGAFQVQLENLFPDVTLDGPMVLLQAPGDATNWYVFERGGQVWRIATAAMDTLIDFGTVPGVDTEGEGGLLGAAFHPIYPTTQELFLSYTIAGSGHPMDSIVSRVDVSSGSLNMAGEDVLLTVSQPELNHKGGNIAFGPDGMLYIGFGDGGGGGDAHGTIGNGQDKTKVLGKMLRIDVSGVTGYTIPPDNPFVGDGGGVREEIYAYGFRNPFRWSFDKSLGDLWVADVGQNAYEEVDQVTSGSNYGWRVMEGFHCYNPSAGCDTSEKQPPVFEYPHNEGNCSITGGFVYRGTAHPAFAGYYFYGDFCGDRIYAYDTVSGVRGHVASTGFGVTGFAQGLNGELYVLDLFGGRIFHVVPAP